MKLQDLSALATPLLKSIYLKSQGIDLPVATFSCQHSKSPQHAKEKNLTHVKLLMQVTQDATLCLYERYISLVFFSPLLFKLSVYNKFSVIEIMMPVKNPGSVFSVVPSPAPLSV